MAEESTAAVSRDPVMRITRHALDGQREVIEMPLVKRAKLPSARVAREKGRRQTSSTTTPTGIATALSNGIVPRRLRDRDTFEIIGIIRDLDPQVSQAVWNYLRLMNPGHDLRAISAEGGSDREQKGEAQDFLDDLAKRVGVEYGGGLDQLHNVLNLTLITKAAEVIEVTPTADLTDVDDWYPVDPAYIAFRRTPEGRLEMGQMTQTGLFEPLNDELIFYQPLDPDVNDPYGRLPILSVVSTVVTMASTIQDLRAMSHNQGYPRIDVSVDWDVLLKAAPTELKAPGSEAQLMEWASVELDDVVAEYQDLAVDDTFVHFGFVDLKMVGGTAPASLGFNFKDFIEILERRQSQGLKTLPILSGLGTGSETQGSIQWQMQVAGIEALQRVTKRLVERAAGASMRLAGYPGRAKLTYLPIRTVDRLYEAQSGLFEVKAHQVAVEEGWESADQAAQALYGHKAFGPALPTQPNTDLNPNNSGDKTPGAAGNGPGAGGDEVQPPNEVEAKQKASFDLLMLEMRDGAPVTPVLPNLALGATRLTDPSNELVAKYADAAGLIFRDAIDALVETLAREGIELRDLPADVADYVFGLRYARQMKALLRESIAEGMREAGISEPEVPERIVRRIWEENRQYVTHIKEDLRAALRDGELQTLEDVQEWFRSNAWREDLMGRYLAKQGLTAGFSYGRSLLRTAVRFQWALGSNDNHCFSCLSRAGEIFSHDELLSRGFPGSGGLICGANCMCSLVEVE